MQVTIYHNPRCSNSRRCLEIIREQGLEPTVVEYLQHPPSVAVLETLVGKMGVNLRDVMRTREPAYAELKLAQADNSALFKAATTHPILLNRPIVVTDKGAKLCRPPELVHELL